MRRLARLGFLACAVAAGCSPAQGGAALEAPRTPPPRQTRDADAILDALTERYASTKTYEDEGVQTSAVRGDGNSTAFEKRTVFRTAFERATGAFFFGYEQTVTPPFSGPTRGAIWRADSAEARHWWTVKADVRRSSLEAAIAGFTGVSGGTAYVVPAMLVGFGGHPRSGAAFEVVGEEVVAGGPCTKLFAREPDDERETTLWIARATPALRRIRERSRIVREALSREQAALKVPASAPEDVRQFIIEDYMRRATIVTESTTDYAPVFDRPIVPARFHFTPPAT